MADLVSSGLSQVPLPISSSAPQCCQLAVLPVTTVHACTVVANGRWKPRWAGPRAVARCNTRAGPCAGHDTQRQGTANVDFAIGYERVVVLAPITGWVRSSGNVDRQIRQLCTDARVKVVSPDTAARSAMGRGSLDPASRASRFALAKLKAPPSLIRSAQGWD